MATKTINVTENSTVKGTKANDKFVITSETKNATIIPGNIGTDTLYFGNEIATVRPNIMADSKDLHILYQLNGSSDIYTIIIKDYFTSKKATDTKSSLKNIRYVKNDKEYKLSLINDIYFSNNNMPGTRYTLKNNILTGTKFGDYINEFGDTDDTGYIINSGNGSDYIIGSKGNDTINASNGNDDIFGNGGNDILTGGKGINIYHFNNIFHGNNKIKLTKGETVNIKIDNSSSTSNIAYELDEKNNAKIYFDKTNENTTAAELINFASKDITKAANLILNDNSTINLKTGVQWEKTISKSYNGSYLSEKIDASSAEQQYKTVKKKGKKVKVETDLVIKGGNGNDKITGSAYSDNINGGNGNDTINGSIGADKIAGGKGINTIVYTSLDQIDGDKIKLTKGEKLTIDVSDIENSEANYRVSGKNLIVSVTNGTGTKEFTIVNFGTKDVTNNKTKKKPDTSSVELITSEDTIDLREEAIVSSTNGTYHNDIIDRSGYTNKKKKGLNLNGKAGNDEIIGTQYNDTIKAGTGLYEEITGGTGNDKLYASTTKASSTTFNFKAGDGKDIVYSGKGNDSLKFNINDIKFINGAGKNKKDLIIKYNYNENGTPQDSVTIKNYYTVNKKGKVTGINKNNSIKNINLCGTLFNIETLKELIENDAKISSSSINGTTGDDIIIGTGKVTGNYQMISGNGGNDIVYCSNNCYSYVTLGDGHDTVYGGDYQTNIYGILDVGNGNNTIYFGNSHMYTNLGEDSDTVYLKGFQDIWFNGNNADNGITNGGHDTVYYSENARGYLRFYKTVYDDMIFTRADGSDDLVMRYGENNSVTFKDYYKAGNENFGNITMYALREAGKTQKVNYTINNAILDKGGAGNDIYNSISIESKTVINDNGGNDIVNISKDKARTYILFNVNKDGTFAEGNDKLILTTQSYFNTWKTSGAEPTYSLTINDFDSIETIKTTDGCTLTVDKLNTLKADVTAWLLKDGIDGVGGNGIQNYNDVKAALTSGNDVSDLVAMFNRDSNWQ